MIKTSEARESDARASPCRFTTRFQHAAYGLAEELQSLSTHDSDRGVHERSGVIGKLWKGGSCWPRDVRQTLAIRFRATKPWSIDRSG